MKFSFFFPINANVHSACTLSKVSSGWIKKKGNSVSLVPIGKRIISVGKQAEVLVEFRGSCC